MKVVCAWCGTLIKQGAAHLVSHGLCSACRHNPEILQGKSPEIFANTFPFPVVILDSSLQPVAINRSAYQNLTNYPKLSGDSTMGVIVECRHSREPGSCGHTIHCTGCVLRNTIAETNRTGEPFTDIPAKLTTDAKEVVHYISTRKVDGHVVVKMTRREE